MSNALDAPILEELAGTKTEVSTDRTFIMRFVSDYVRYLTWLNRGKIPDVFCNINKLDLGEVLKVVKKKNWSTWMRKRMKIPSLVSNEVIDLIISLYYWIQINTDTLGTVFRKMYNDYSIEQRTKEVIYQVFSASDLTNKINILWYLVAGQRTLREGFLSLTYHWGKYAFQQSSIDEDKALIDNFIFTKTYLIQAKNSFIGELFYQKTHINLNINND